MNEARRATVQLIVGAVLAFTLTGSVVYLAITAQDNGERQLLIGMLGGGFGAAIAYFLGNFQHRQTGTTIQAEPPSTVNVTNTDAPPETRERP